MKKKLFNLVISLLIFIPLLVSAKEKNYEYFDFRANMFDGENINNTDIRIYASVGGDEKNLVDRTSEFDILETIWSVCIENDCGTSEQVNEEAVFEEDKKYVFMIRIVAKNNADIDVWGTEKVKFNGTQIEKMNGEYANSGKELMIKTWTSREKSIYETTPDDTTEEVTPTGTTRKCLLGLPLCCNIILGLPICVWIVIIIILILIIIGIFLLKGKKKEENIQPMQFYNN